MNFYLKDSSGKPSETATLSAIVTMAAVLRFLLDGISFNVLGQSFTFSHVDSMTYLAFLGPILGTHGYMKVNEKEGEK